MPWNSYAVRDAAMVAAKDYLAKVEAHPREYCRKWVSTKTIGLCGPERTEYVTVGCILSEIHYALTGAYPAPKTNPTLPHPGQQVSEVTGLTKHEIHNTIQRHDNMDSLGTAHLAVRDAVAFLQGLPVDGEDSQ